MSFEFASTDTLCIIRHLSSPSESLMHPIVVSKTKLFICTDELQFSSSSVTTC